MSKNHKKRNRNGNLSPTPPEPPKHHGIEALRQFFEASPPPGSGDVSHIPISAGNATEPAPASPADAGSGETPAGPGSRGNSLKSSYRSKVLFNPSMFEALQKATEEFTLDIRPVGALERFLTRELGRCAAQDEKLSEQLLINEMRIIERVGTSWDIDKSAFVETIGKKLGDSPQAVVGALGRSKHGALYLIKQWIQINEIIITNKCVDDNQRETIFNLLGIDHVYRSGSRQVPAGTDTEGLKALVARQLGLLHASLKETLNDTDLAERKMAALGIAGTRDSVTRNLRADQNRARKRFIWAFEMIQQLRRGVDPLTLIDPDTNRPLAPGPEPTVVRPPAQAAAAATAAASAAPPPSEPEPARSVPPLPEGLPADAMEMFLVAAGSILGPAATVPSRRASGAAWPPPTA